MCQKAWDLVKLKYLHDFADERPKINQVKLCKVLFFSGSVGFGSGNTDFGDKGRARKATDGTSYQTSAGESRIFSTRIGNMVYVYRNHRSTNRHVSRSSCSPRAISIKDR